MYTLYKSFDMVGDCFSAHANINLSTNFFLSSKGGESKSSEPVTPSASASASASGTGSTAAAYVMPSAENTRIRSIKVNSSGTMVALLTGIMRLSISVFSMFFH